MKFNTEYLLEHLRRINASGEIGEVVLRPDLSASAITPDQAFFVDAPAFTDEPLWDEPVGVPDFDFMVKAMEKRSRHRSVVDLELNNNSTRLWLDGKVAVALSEPDKVGTPVNDESRQVLLDQIAGHDGVPVHRDAAQEFLDFRKLTGAMEITWSVGPDGTEVVVGHRETGQHALTFFEEVRADPAYEILWQANACVAAFADIQDWEEARVILTGEGSVGAVREGGWTYVLSPLE